ncbi:P-type conjugative transfer ATPase TrbB [Phenylobacterium sp. LjRoot164]
MGPVVAAALADPSVVEVMVNPDGAIWIERAGEGRCFSGERMAAADADRVLRLVADHAGEVVTRERPMLSTTLPETGDRFQGVYMPVVSAPSFAIRKRPERIFGLDDYVRAGAMTAAQADILRCAAQARANILIAGGTGAGKTTLANAVLALPAFAEDRVVLIEDTAELQCSARDQIALLTRRQDPQVSLAELVRAALRLRPDRIVIGEVRDGGALDLLKAWNTGHPGGLATLHANSAEDALGRLEDLIGEAAAVVPRRAIGQAVDLIAFLRRAPGGRRLEGLVRVEGWRAGGYVLRPAAP